MTGEYTKIALVSCSNGMTESFRPSFYAFCPRSRRRGWKLCMGMACLPGRRV